VLARHRAMVVIRPMGWVDQGFVSDDRAPGYVGGARRGIVSSRCGSPVPTGPGWLSMCVDPDLRLAPIVGTMTSDCSCLRRVPSTRPFAVRGPPWRGQPVAKA